MDVKSDGVDCFILPDGARCKLDEDKEYILDLACCPLGNEFCSGWCDYYTEDKE